MASAASWLAIVSGAVLTLSGFILTAMFFFGRIPVSGAGLFMLISLVAGPAMAVSGVTVVLAGIGLMNGASWAARTLTTFAWIAFAASVGWLIYSATELENIHAEHVVRGAIFLALTGGPAALLLFLLRSTAH